jgi:hypothetical protein
MWCGRCVRRSARSGLLRRLPRCSHHIKIDADRWPDPIRLSDLEPRFTCQACGHRGADVRPLFGPAAMGTGG